MSSEQEECLRSGMNDIIAKPIDVNQMLQCISSHLQPEHAATHIVSQQQQAADKPWDLDQLQQTIGDDEQLIARLLTQFQQESRQLPEQLQALLEQQDTSGAARLVHTLKGHAGTFGAQPLAQLAKRVELAIREENFSELNSLQSDLFEQLSQLQLAITAWLDQHRPPAQTLLPTSDYHEKLKMLGFLLQESNLSALDLFDEIKGGLLQNWGSDTVDKLAAAMEALDFSQALQLLEANQNAD